MDILVTGSARLEAFHAGGDSLAGRFFRHRILPISPAELSLVGEPVDLERLMQFGGFPEPYLSYDPIESDRNDYLGIPCSLNYLRTKDRTEIDFCIAGKHAPEIMIEAKLSDETPGKSIINFNRIRLLKPAVRPGRP